MEIEAKEREGARELEKERMRIAAQHESEQRALEAKQASEQREHELKMHDAKERAAERAEANAGRAAMMDILLKLAQRGRE